MGITKKTSAEIEALAVLGHSLQKILQTLGKATTPGVTTLDLDDMAMELVEQYEVEPVLLGYHPGFASYPYPAAVCVSVNHCVQHGIPSETVVLAEGDVVNIDMSIGRDGLVVDAGITVGVGTISPENQKLISVTQEALMHGIKAAVPGGHIGDIGAAIQQFVESRGLSVVRDLCGHGVGYAVHEEPTITNFGTAGTGPRIEVGHVYAIEPIVNSGSHEVYFDDAGDGYSVYTKDGSNSAHFEHTVAITAQGPRILTK